MIDLIIEGTHQTPEVKFHKNGALNISGRSIPKNAEAFYSPILEWLEQYKDIAPFDTLFTFDLDYLNINSSKLVLEILYKLDGLLEQGKNPTITWFYADDEMLEIGQDYNSLINVPFQFLKKKDYIEVAPVFS